MLLSKLPRGLSGPVWAVMSRQILLVSTWSPRRSRWISLSCKCRIGVLLDAVGAVAVSVKGTEKGIDSSKPFAINWPSRITVLTILAGLWGTAWRRSVVSDWIRPGPNPGIGDVVVEST